MTPFYQTLANLIVLAEEVVTRPMSDRQAIAVRLRNLAEAVRAADRRPAEDVRTTQAALVMIVALEEIRDSEHDASQPWRMITGAMLPLLRTAAYVELQKDRGVRE